MLVRISLTKNHYRSIVVPTLQERVQNTENRGDLSLACLAILPGEPL